MTKLYFTDPIKALWMMKEFKVKFDLECEEGLRSYLGVGLDEQSENFKKKLRLKSLFYVAKESEHIFELKEQDVIITSTGCLAYHEAEFFDKDSKIIMRDGKQFFNPESE